MKTQALYLEGDPRNPEVVIRSTSMPAAESGQVLVRVAYSSLNYKDGLAVTGKGAIIKSPFPFIPGIDLAGEVLESRDPRFNIGDQVVGTGAGLGEVYPGGYTGLQRVRTEDLVVLPPGMDLKQSMALGTAGFTAMLAVIALEAHGINPESNGEVLVTGASGGVGSIAVAILAGRGYRVVASTGKAEASTMLSSLGASRIIGRNDVMEGVKRPLEHARWIAAIDTVGGTTLAAVLATLGRHGCVACCGNAGGAELNTTVFPFILRGATLAGIDSNTPTREEREAAWAALAREVPREAIDDLVQEIDLRQIPEYAARITRGEITGRVVVVPGCDPQ